MIPDDAEKQLQWTSDRAYKMAVHHVGLTDWSTATQDQKDKVEYWQHEYIEWLVRLVLGRVQID